MEQFTEGPELPARVIYEGLRLMKSNRSMSNVGFSCLEAKWQYEIPNTTKSDI